MQSAIVKRSVVIGGHKTSVSLEDAFWDGLREIGRSQSMTLSNLVGQIDVRRPHANLSSAIRLFVLGHFRSQIPPSSIFRIVAGAEAPQNAHAGRGIHQANGKAGEWPAR
jgi:predicted DNA-binding ribbon-helix-helix protein